MAYATYTTAALVCGSHDSYTSDRSYLLFTKEAGMLWATARSVREEKSKQRYALQDFSIIRVSLVKGRSGWRIGSVEAIRNPFLSASSRGEGAYIKNIVSLLRRYIHGEQAIASVYHDAQSALLVVSSEEERDALYLLFTVRLLYTLGYISKNEAIEDILGAPDFYRAFELYDSKQLNTLEKIVVNAHDLSHL